MLDILQMYGQYPIRGRNNYKCFAHDDQKPSAGLTKQGDKFHCFACGYTGNIFDVVQYFEKCDLKTAMKILDDKFKLGLYRQLSHKEKLELAKQMKERERQQKEKLWWERYEKSILADITNHLRLYEDCERQLKIQKGQYRGEWSNEYGDVYFYVLKQIKWFDWLYSILTNALHKECEYDFLYPTDKKELLKMIKNGNVSHSL